MRAADRQIITVDFEECSVPGVVARLLDFLQDDLTGATQTAIEAASRCLPEGSGEYSHRFADEHSAFKAIVDKILDEFLETEQLTAAELMDIMEETCRVEPLASRRLYSVLAALDIESFAALCRTQQEEYKEAVTDADEMGL